MKLLIDIPKEFEQHFREDRFEDSLRRLSADAHLLAGLYEQETATMLYEALKNAVPVPPHGDLIDRDALAVHKFVTEHDKYRQNDIPNMDGGACYRRGWDDAVDAIMVNASTVIPASEEGET